jgi:hypothetical protein
MKLVKRENDYCLYNESEETIAASWANVTGKKLSQSNCDEIFGVVDVEKLAEELYNGHAMAVDWQLEKSGFKTGFNKAMGLYQPTEIDVEIEMECKIGCDNFIFNGDKSICCGNKIKKLDSNGNLILRKL